MEKLAVLKEFMVKVETLKKVKFHIYIFQVGLLYMERTSMELCTQKSMIDGPPCSNHEK